MRGVLLGLAVFWTLVGVAANHAFGAEPVCITKDRVMERVRVFISPKAAGALMKPEQTAQFAKASGFPYPVSSFLVVAVPNTIGVFAFNSDGCAMDRDGFAAEEENEAMVILISPDTLKRLLKEDGDSI